MPPLADTPFQRLNDMLEHMSSKLLFILPNSESIIYALILFWFRRNMNRVLTYLHTDDTYFLTYVNWLIFLVI